MHIRDHLEKARRIDAVLQELDLEDDFEMMVEGFMLVGTHFVNGALHAKNITHENWDLLHGDKPSLDDLKTVVDTDIQDSLAALKIIEDARPVFVRGPRPYNASAMRSCHNSYNQIKEICNRIIEKAENVVVS